MAWSELLGLAKAASDATKTYGDAPEAAPVTSGGVGPWAQAQGEVPGSFLEKYLQTGSVFSQQAKRKKAKPEPVPEAPQKTSLIAQGVLGDRGNKAEGAALDSVIDVGAQAVGPAIQAIQASQAAAASTQAASGAAAGASSTGGSVLAGPAGAGLMNFLMGVYGGVRGAQNRMPGESATQGAMRGVAQSSPTEPLYSDDPGKGDDLKTLYTSLLTRDWVKSAQKIGDLF